MNSTPVPTISGAEPAVAPPNSYQLMVQLAGTLIGRWAAEIRGGVSPDRQRELTRMMLRVRLCRDDVGVDDEQSATVVIEYLLQLHVHDQGAAPTTSDQRPCQLSPGRGSR